MIDPSVDTELQAAHRAEQLARMRDGLPWRIDGPASPRWIPCPAKECEAPIGTECLLGRGPWCPKRVDANAKRMDQHADAKFKYGGE